MSSRRLKIGIVCYPTYGGSGVIATEIGMAMGRRGHSIHFVCIDLPRRFDRFLENVYFHEVVLRDYPVFVSPPYALGLASKLVEVCAFERLDLLHVHYAVPHATSAYLAKQVLGPGAPKIITTLHGTDITLVGYDRSYLPITRFSIQQSDAVTVPSMYLRNATYDKLNLPSELPIEVIPNFVNTDDFSPAAPGMREDNSCVLKRLKCAPTEKVLIHVSNFRPVKRIADIIKIFERVQREVKCHLILIGDGPDRSMAEALVRELKIEKLVCFLGKQETFAPILSLADVFLMPSETESFGLAALEAMSCGVPVVASKIHGIPEVVTEGETGFLFPVGDIESMAQGVLTILRDPVLHQRMRTAAREKAVKAFGLEQMITRYEEFYERVLGA
jgi:L-malate glycosyltransferase